MNDKCPNCGACKHCGYGGFRFYQPYYIPYMPSYPQPTWGGAWGGINTGGNVTVTPLSNMTNGTFYNS